MNPLGNAWMDETPVIALGSRSAKVMIAMGSVTLSSSPLCEEISFLLSVAKTNITVYIYQILINVLQTAYSTSILSSRLFTS